MSGYERNEKWKYHIMKCSVKKSAIKAIRGAVQKEGFWKAKNKADGEKCLMILGNLGKKLCNIYKIALHGRITYGEENIYFHVDGTIQLVRPSIVSYLHEFRHHWQNMTGKHMDSEKNARKWSLNAFKKSFPDAFDDAWKLGRLMWMPSYKEEEK